MKARRTGKSSDRNRRTSGSRKTTTHRRSQKRQSASSSSGRTSRSANITTDHDEIQEWVESRGGHPATVKRTRRSNQAAGILRIDFPGYSGEESLKEISWDDWFEMFEDRKLAFLYQDTDDSRFNKLISRED